jgi:hypothetical protein
MDHPKILPLAVVLFLASFPAMADKNPPMRLSDKCEVAPGYRPPRSGEYCDYITAIRECDGDLTERLFRIPRNPRQLMSDVGPEMPRRLRCHRDGD